MSELRIFTILSTISVMLGLYLLAGIKRAIAIMFILIAIIFFLLAMDIGSRAEGAERDGWFMESQGVYEFGVPGGYTAGKVTCAGGKFLNDWSSVRAEIEVGELWFSHPESSGLQAGASFILRFDPKIYKQLRFYTDIGVGVGYADVERSQGCVIPGIVGLVDAGTGIIFPIGYKNVDFILGWRFSHVSSLRPGDAGVNTHGVGIGLIWRF